MRKSTSSLAYGRSGKTSVLHPFKTRQPTRGICHFSSGKRSTRGFLAMLPPASKAPVLPRKHQEGQCLGGDSHHARVGGTKKEASEDSISALPILQRMLEWRRSQVKPNPDDYIFAGKRRGALLNFHNLENRVIKPALEKTKLNGQPSVEWKGLHGLRRGLASDLFSLGVNPKVIAALLRHSDIGTTLQYYNSVPESETRPAMEKLEARVLNPPPSGLIVNGKMVGPNG